MTAPVPHTGSDAGIPYRVPFVGRDVRLMFLIAAAVCGFFAVPAAFELVEALSDGRTRSTGNVVWHVATAVFFGIPTLAALFAAIRPPRRTIVLDHEGLRLEGGRRPIEVRWSQLDAVAISISRPSSRFIRSRSRFYRRTSILFAALPGAQLDDRLTAFEDDARFSHELVLPTSPLTPDESPLVRGLAEAMQKTAGARFAGVQHREH